MSVGRHGVGRLRAREHERLQAAAKWDRDRPGWRAAWWAMTEAQGALYKFIRTGIPLAGPQTPRALRPAREARRAATEAYLARAIDDANRLTLPPRRGVSP